MPLGGCATSVCAIAGVGVGVGAWLVAGFVRNIREYRDSAKRAALLAPEGFALHGAAWASSGWPAPWKFEGSLRAFSSRSRTMLARRALPNYGAPQNIVKPATPETHL